MTTRTNRRTRLRLEALEGRDVPDATSAALVRDLVARRDWITFSPPRPFDPTHAVDPTVAQLRASLQQLHDEGWRGLVTYSLDGTLRAVPQLAKEVGFTRVVAGLFWFDDAQLAREK